MVVEDAPWYVWFIYHFVAQVGDWLTILKIPILPIKIPRWIYGEEYYEGENLKKWVWFHEQYGKYLCCLWHHFILTPAWLFCWKRIKRTDIKINYDWAKKTFYKGNEYFFEWGKD